MFEGVIRIMKIILFDINSLSFNGGAEKYFSEVGEIFCKRGNEVFFVGHCRPIMRFFIWLSILLFVNPVWKLPKLFSQFKRQPPLDAKKDKDIIYIPLKLTSLLPFSSERKKIRLLFDDANAIFIKNELFELLFFWLLKIRNKRKYIMVFTPIKYPDAKTIRAKAHNYFYQSRLYIQLVKSIGQVIVSNKNDEFIFQHDFRLKENNIFNIPYGLNDSYFAKKNEIVSKPNFNILFAGRMEEQKGISCLKEIIEDINTSFWGQKIDFFLAGSGPMENIPKELSANYSNVKYLGQVAPDKLRQYYLRSDLVILTSRWESFTYVCFEAQVCGCPVVAFNIPGPADIIEKNTGLLVPLGNIINFQNSVYYYVKLKMKRPEYYLTMRNDIAQVSAKKYSIKNTVDNLTKIIQN